MSSLLLLSSGQLQRLHDLPGESGRKYPVPVLLNGVRVHLFKIQDGLL